MFVLVVKLVGCLGLLLFGFDVGFDVAFCMVNV